MIAGDRYNRNLNPTTGLTRVTGWAQRQLFLDLDGVVCVTNLQRGGLRRRVPIQHDQSKVQVHEVFAAPEPIRFAVKVMKQAVGGVMSHTARGDVVQGLRVSWLVETGDLAEVPIAAEENHVTRAASNDEVEQALTRLRKIPPFLIGMLVCDHLDPGANQINIRATFG
jgi:hypothetical protein